MATEWTDEQIAIALEVLRQPFPLEVVQIKVGATYEKDGTSYGLGLAYADWWTGYLPALQRVLGPGGWNIELTPWGNQKVIAGLTAFGGRIVHWSSGESEADDPNCGTSAEAQAKKRVCAEALGLGLYFYHAPKLWGVVTHKGKGATFATGEEERLKLELYGRMGLLREQPSVQEVDRTGAPAMPLSRNHVAPEPERLSRARAALAEGERRAGVQLPAESGSAASDKQVGAILSLLRACREAGTQPATLNRIGNTVGLSGLSGVQHAADLTALPKSSASQLIASLQQVAPQRQARAS
jgi:hypothetical protein